MKIIIITNEYSINGGGLSYSCCQFYRLLTQMGHHVDIWSSAIDNNSTIHGGYDSHLGRNIEYETKLKNDQERIGRDVLLIAFGGGFNAYYASILRQKKQNRYWILFRGSDANLCKWDMTNISYTVLAIKNAERIITLSKEMADNLQQVCYHNFDIKIIPNHSIRINTEIKFAPGSTLKVGCGAFNLNEKKGVSKLIEMVSIYEKTFQNKLVLELVGAVDPDVLIQYKNIAKQFDVLGNVHFLGVKSRDEFRNIQCDWDFYVQTSICEGMGNSVVDSMSMGIPIMITNTGYIAELAKNIFPEFLFTNSNPVDMAQQLHRVATNYENMEKYKLFYDLFFQLTSEESITAIWEELFIAKKQKKQMLTNTVISVSLHDIAGEYHDNITTPIHVFRKFVEDIYESGYRLCSMKEYVALEDVDKPNHIVCTFDDGYVGLLDNAFAILDKYGFTATVFVCFNYMGKSNDWNFKDKISRVHLNIEDLRFLQTHGWEIGSHGMTHRSLLRLSDEELKTELSQSKYELEQTFGQIISYAYPYGDYSDYIMKEVKKYYDYAFLLTQGGVFLSVDSLRIHRYYISEIYQMIK